MLSGKLVVGDAVEGIGVTLGPSVMEIVTTLPSLAVAVNAAGVKPCELRQGSRVDDM